MWLKTKIIILGLVLITMLVTYVTGHRLYISSSSSLKQTVFLQTQDKSAIKKGDIVSFTYKAGDKWHYHNGDNFTKIVSCTPGDILERIGDIYKCNDKSIGEVKLTDMQGTEEIESFYFSGIVPANKYFLIGTHPYSYDSRYYGFVDIKDIKGVAYGLL